MASASYPLSARNASIRSEIIRNNGAKPWVSCVCPGVRTKPSGRPFASHRAWSLEVKPPRDRLRKLAAARFNQQAAEKAVWQRRVRGYLVRALADMRQLKRPPRQEELAQYVLETLAEQSNDPDYLAVIGPFSRNLPDAYRDRWQAREVVRRFHDRQENRKAGRWPPLEP